MSLSNRSLRTVLRWSHVVAGALVAAFVYSPLRESDAFVLLVQAALIPALVLTGLWRLWMSQQARIKRLLGGKREGR